MKRLSFIAAGIAALVFTACQEDMSVVESTSLDIESAAFSVSSESALETSYEDVASITDEGMERFFEEGSRLGHGFGRLLECAEVERDTTTNTITIDFGDGCEDHHGTLRSGKIIVQYSGAKREPGSYRKVTFDNFKLDSILVEGVRTMTNATDTTVSDVYVFETKLEGGKLTFTDGSVATREAAHVRTLYKGESMDEDYATLSGGASGVLQDGTEYSSTILEDLVFSKSCRTHVPVSGVKEMISGDNTVVMDFGDGACDNLVEVTTNGETETIEIEGRDKMADGCGKHGKRRGKH